MSGAMTTEISSELNNNCLVQLKHINKAFGGVKAVEDVSLNLYPGEVNTPILEHRPNPVSEEHKQRILQPEHVAELVLCLVSLPPSVHVPEVVIKPLWQGWY